MDSEESLYISCPSVLYTYDVWETIFEKIELAYSLPHSLTHYFKASLSKLH